jgi:hypothetical protein
MPEGCAELFEVFVGHLQTLRSGTRDERVDDYRNCCTRDGNIGATNAPL